LTEFTPAPLVSRKSGKSGQISEKWLDSRQGAYNSGKPGKLGEFLYSGQLRENSGNFKFIPGIFVSVIVGIEFCA